MSETAGCGSRREVVVALNARPESRDLRTVDVNRDRGLCARLRRGGCPRGANRSPARPRWCRLSGDPRYDAPAPLRARARCLDHQGGEGETSRRAWCPPLPPRVRGSRSPRSLRSASALASSLDPTAVSLRSAAAHSSHTSADEHDASAGQRLRCPASRGVFGLGAAADHERVSLPAKIIREMASARSFRGVAVRRRGDAPAERRPQPPGGFSGQAVVAPATGRAGSLARRDAGASVRLRLPGGSARPWTPRDHPAAARDDSRVRPAARLLLDEPARRSAPGGRRSGDRARVGALRHLRGSGGRPRERAGNEWAIAIALIAAVSVALLLFDWREASR